VRNDHLPTMNQLFRYLLRSCFHCWPKPPVEAGFSRLPDRSIHRERWMIGGSTIARAQPLQIRRFASAGSGIGIPGEDVARAESRSWISRKLPSLLSCSEEQVHS
jgi:hypothetical protein